MFKYLFNYDVTIHLLALAGIYIVLIWLFDNVRSLILIIFNLLRPLFQPEEKKSLVEKYGDWAGMIRNFF